MGSMGDFELLIVFELNSSTWYQSRKFNHVQGLNGLCAQLFNLNHSICLAQKGRDLHIKPRDLIDNMMLFHS